MTDVRRAAREYIERGYTVVPILPGEKFPKTPGWPDLRLGASDVEAAFRETSNIGLLLGEPSGGLVDIDLDSEEAEILAHHFLPKTGMVHGRSGRRPSHYWYLADDLLNEGYKDPEGGAEHDRSTLVEIRAAVGHQTVVPPSTHPSGDKIEWVSFEKPARVDGTDLKRRVAWLAIASLLVRVWHTGSRNDLTLAVAGWLMRSGVEQARVASVIRWIAGAAGDDEVDARERIVESTGKKLAGGEPVAGITRLADIVGDKRAKHLAEWLALATAGTTRSRGLPPPLGARELAEWEDHEIEFLVDGLLQAASNVLVVGYPKSHKTNFCLELSVALASGTKFLGHFATGTARRVGIVLMEDHRTRIKRRMDRIALARKTTLKELDGHLFFWFRPEFRFTDKDVMGQMATYVKQDQLDVLVVDNWSLVSDGDSDDADLVTPQLRAFADLRQARPNLSVVLVHHARKSGMGQGKRITDIARNSTAFGAWYDTGILLESKSGGDLVGVRVELRDLPSPADFEFQVLDETPGSADGTILSSGYLKLKVAERSGTGTAYDKLETQVVEFVDAHPGCSQGEVVEVVPAQKARVVECLKRLCKDGQLHRTKQGRRYQYWVEKADAEDPDAPPF